MKATVKKQVTGVTLKLTVKEARQLAGLLYSVKCVDGRVSLNGLAAPGEAGQYALPPPDHFDGLLFDTLLAWLPPIGDDE